MAKKQTRPHQVAGIDVGTLDHAMEVGGFDLGVVVDDRFRQATIQFSVGSSQVVGESTWREWEALAGRMRRVIALFTTDVAGGKEDIPARAGAVFHAEERSEKKDVSGFVARLLVEASPMFSYADSTGLASIPLDEAGVVEAVNAGLGVDAGSWADLANIDVDETDANIVVGAECFSVFVAPADSEEISAEIDEIMQEWEGEVPLRRTRLYRPLIVADADTDDELAGGGRRHILITVGGGDEGAAVFVSALSDRARVAVRRCWCRQRSLLIAGLGLGVLGFQRGAGEVKRPAVA